jgi:hypothetical protein
MLFFLPPEPPTERLLALEFPDLEVPKAREEDSDEDSIAFGWINYDSLINSIIGYLSERQPTAQPATLPDTSEEPKKKRRKQINEIPSGYWRFATLDDLLDAYNADMFRWGLNQYFTVAEFQEFAERHVPPLLSRLRDALQTPNGAERLAVFGALQMDVNRLFTILAALPGRLTEDVQKLRVSMDRERVRVARRQAKEDGRNGLSVDDCIALLERVETDTVVQELLLRIARSLSENQLEQAEIFATLERLGKIKRIREATMYFPQFWEKIGKVVRLEPTETGKTIDITDAREQTVALDWNLLKAKRVGPIVPERAALVVYDKNGESKAYVRGERKLKFQVQSAPKGRKEKYGCTLVMREDPEKQRMQGFLLDVERLDTLAQLDPPAAVALVPAAADLPANHSVRSAAEAARTDWRQARVLADLLIELHTGADADIIRRIARSQNRANRR